jgi:hypothetical protein
MAMLLCLPIRANFAGIGEATSSPAAPLSARRWTLHFAGKWGKKGLLPPPPGQEVGGFFNV